MEIILYDSVRQITGNSIIKYTNNSPDSIDRIYMHLYPNAFQLGSVKYREYRGNSGRGSRAKYFKNKLDGFASKIDVHDLSISVPKEGSSWIHKIPILNEYKIDDTILDARLNRMIGPGEIIRIDLNWTHHVGEMVERAGYYEGQYNMAQWYPKLAVYDQDGWHADVFHAEGEFYGEFGDFYVKFDIPKTFVIGASGVVTSGDPGWADVTVDTSIEYSVWLDIYNSNLIEIDESERRKVTFFAENVHDFAWVASKDFLYEGGLSGDGETKIHVLYDKERGEDWTKVVLERSINALDWLEQKFGNYVYPQITTTDRIKNGGMEYPMLVMNGRDDESLIVHEYGHVYFYGILANNELDEAWLDEGFTTNQTTNYMMSRYGPHGFDTGLYDDYSKFPKKYYPLGNDLHSDQWWAIRLIRSGYDENISRSSYLFNNGSAYGRNAYTKPSLMLFELNYIFGDSLYYGAMQHYYDRWRLKHVNEDRFVETFEEYVDRDLDWFFKPWLHTTRRLDYEISFFNRTINKNGSWDIELGINSLGNRFMPMLVETTFDDGSVSRKWWDEHLWRFQDTLRYSTPKKPLSVTLDPDAQTLDLDFRNNSTKMKKKILFDWPGISYNPRDEMVYWWSPHFYYYSQDFDFAPGLNIEREYGPYESTTIQTNYALESNNIYWYISGWRESVHYFPRTTFYFWGFDKPGVREFGLEIEKKWNRIYRSTPTHTFSGGFYIQSDYDDERAWPLGFNTQGKLAVSSFSWGASIGALSLDLNGASSVGSLSTWNFDRLTGIASFKYKKKLGSVDKKNTNGNRNFVLDVKQRIIIGKIWTDDLGVPSQEGYNIEGNGSNEMLKKNYLIDQFYGNKTLFSHYHIPGEGNIRGFVGKGERGADALIAMSNELSILKNIAIQGIEDINLEFTAFMDGGTFWDKMNHPWYPEKNYHRILGDAGLGIRIKTSLFEKDLYIRFDFPFFIYNNGSSDIDYNNWLFSFQKGL
ncbi:MAG: M1 family metallopeptidase [Candidatus Neomarinimicrobiota bacterium]